MRLVTGTHDRPLAGKLTGKRETSPISGFRRYTNTRIQLLPPYRCTQPIS